MSGTTNYPSALDNDTTLPVDKTDDTLTATDHPAHHNNLAAAVRAVQTELGTDPSGANYTTVKDAIAGKVDFSPTAEQIIQGTGDIVGLTVKATAAQSLKNVFQMRLSNNAIGAFIDKDGNFSAQALKIAGAALAASHLANGVTGAGAVVLASALSPFAPLASPALSGTPTAPTQAGGDNSTKIATTAFVTAAVGAISQTAGTSGLLSARPAANVSTGVFYYATDQAVLFFSDGTNWQRMSVPAGSTVDWLQPAATVPTGWIAYDGSTIVSTGIFADLYAHLGNSTTLPDTRGRMAVGKGTHADVSTIGNNDGVAVGSRRPKHKHAVNESAHSHGIQGFIAKNSNGGTGSAGDSSGDRSQFNISGTGSATTGLTVGPQTGSEPQDTAAYIVTLKIAKL
jgi:hypothetical protein